MNVITSAVNFNIFIYKKKERKKNYYTIQLYIIRIKLFLFKK